jgi:hypothetical protein
MMNKDYFLLYYVTRKQKKDVDKNLRPFFAQRFIDHPKKKESSRTDNWETADFYLPHMEYEGSIGFVSRKMKKNYC